MTAALKAGGVLVKLDARDEFNAGYKYNDWEMRGVPLRIGIGPRDVEQNAVVFARATSRAKRARRSACRWRGSSRRRRRCWPPSRRPCSSAPPISGRRTRATVRDYDEFKQVLEAQGGFIRVHWAGASEDEDRIKEETKATIRCYPFDAPEGEGVCFYTGKKTDRVALFARAY